MNIFGIGTSELIVILIIAMLVVGPERLAQVAGQIGRTIARFRMMTNEMTKDFHEALGDEVAEVQAAYKEITGETAAAANEMASAAGEVTTAAAVAAAPSAASIEAAQFQRHLASEMVDGEVTVQSALSETTLEKGPAPRFEAPADGAPMVIEAATLISEEADAEPLEIALAEAVEEEPPALLQPVAQEEKR